MKILLLVGLLVLAMLVFDGVRMYLQIKKSSALIEEAVPFARSIENPSMRILVLGDSTAYGTGSTRSEDTTAGRLGALYRDASIKNRAVNGLKIDGLISILDTIPNTKDSFDLILIQIGANDIIRLTKKDDIQKGITEVFEKTSHIGKQVIVLHSGDVGQATFFPWYVRPIHTHWSYAVRDIYTEISQQYGVAYIDLIGGSVEKALKENPEKYYATDKLHLSNEGYGLWFGEIQKRLSAY